MSTEPATPLSVALASVCAVAITPLTSSGGVDDESAARLAEHAVAEGAGVLTLGGSVGEFLSLAAAERERVLVAALEAVSGRAPVLAAVGGDLASAIQEGARARASGAAGLMVHQPLNPFRSPRGWVDYHVRLAYELAPTPLVLYLRDPAIGIAEIDQLAGAADNVIAVKHAVPDPVALASLTAGLGDRLVWLCGLAELWAPFAWTAGATGFTSGLANVTGWLPRAMLDALQRADSDAVMRLWRLARPFEQLRSRRGGAASVGVVKAALASRGVIAHTTVRPPLEPISDTEAAEVARLMASLESHSRA